MENAEQKLAEVITSMTFGELQSIAQSLCDMHGDRAQDGTNFDNNSDWMSLLHDWAEGTVDNCDS